jgi:hypothetical protein
VKARTCLNRCVEGFDGWTDAEGKWLFEMMQW